MKGDPKAIECLQAQLKNELTAINQYFLHYRMLKHWGFDKLAKKEYDESIGEMKHADLLMDRIFMLDGLPNLQDLGKLLVGEDVPEILACDLKMERAAQATIKDASPTAKACATTSRATCCSTSWTTPRSTSTFWKRSLSWSRRWGCPTTCKARWARSAEAAHEPGKRVGEPYTPCPSIRQRPVGGR